MDTDYESEDQETCSSSYFSYKETQFSHQFESKPKPFSEIGISYKSYNFLVKLSQVGLAFTSHLIKDLFSLMCEVCEYLFLSDLEIVLWGIYLDRFAWQELARDYKYALIFAAYAAKCMMNENTTEHLEKLKLMSGSLPRDYKEWIGAHQNVINVDYYELNFRFNELGYKEIEVMEENKLNYNDMVTDLIDSTLETQKKRLGSDDLYAEKRRK